MDANTLQDTINRYNELKDKEDVDFGKASELMTGIGEGPYYAVPVATYILTAYAGPDITDDCEVLSTEGNVIPGLYGIGELIATNIYGYEKGDTLYFSISFNFVLYWKLIIQHCLMRHFYQQFYQILSNLQ